MRDIKEAITDLEYAIARYGRENSFTLAAYRALKCLKEIQRERQWQPIESAPKSGETILLYYISEYGHWRTTRGQWFSVEHIAEHWDNDKAPEGWYETSGEGWERFPIKPTHWMPLPPPPTDIAAH